MRTRFHGHGGDDGSSVCQLNAAEAAVVRGIELSARRQQQKIGIKWLCQKRGPVSFHQPGCIHGKSAVLRLTGLAQSQQKAKELHGVVRLAGLLQESVITLMQKQRGPLASGPELQLKAFPSGKRNDDAIP